MKEKIQWHMLQVSFNININFGLLNADKHKDICTALDFIDFIAY